MSELDPGGELVREMLERRIAQPPAHLSARIASRVAETPQARGRRRADRLLGPLLLVLLVAVVATGGYLAGRLGRAQGADQGSVPGQSLPVASAAGSSAASADAATSTPSPDAVPGLGAPPTAPPVLTIDRLAVVTTDGFNLRVRSEPGVGDAATRLVPLLDTGTRMLVLRGPIARDNHDWYQVRIDRAPGFGWVAAGAGGVAWLAPAAPGCSGAREPSEVWTRPAMDLLACYGDQPFTVQVVGTGGRQPSPCTAAPDRKGCTAEPGWLLEPMTLVVLGDGPSGTASISVAVPDSVHDAVGGATPDRPLMIMIALDRPLAESCRVVDAAGLDVIARDAAVATCRLTFAVVAVAR